MDRHEQGLLSSVLLGSDVYYLTSSIREKLDLNRTNYESMNTLLQRVWSVLLQEQHIDYALTSLYNIIYNVAINSRACSEPQSFQYGSARNFVS